MISALVNAYNGCIAPDPGTSAVKRLLCDGRFDGRDDLLSESLNKVAIS